MLSYSVPIWCLQCHSPVITPIIQVPATSFQPYFYTRTAKDSRDWVGWQRPVNGHSKFLEEIRYGRGDGGVYALSW